MVKIQYKKCNLTSLNDSSTQMKTNAKKKKKTVYSTGGNLPIDLHFYQKKHISSRSEQLDRTREPQFRKNIIQEPCLYLSSQTYGSNNNHWLREGSQRSLLAIKENIYIFWCIHYSINKREYPPLLLVSYVCSSSYNRLVLMYQSPAVRKYFKMEFTVSLMCT